MNSKIEQITRSLIKLYANDSDKAEAKFRLKLRTIDWDKEERRLKSRLNVYRILFAIIFVLYVLLFIVYVMHISINTASISVAGVAIAIGGLSIALLTQIHTLSRKHNALRLLRELIIGS